MSKSQFSIAAEKRLEIIPYWHYPPEELFSILQSRKEGLTTKEANDKLALLGHNTLVTKKKATPLQLFLNQFISPIVLILLAATIISAFVRDWVDSTIIFIIVLGSAILSFIQEYNANNAVEKLRQQVSHKARVLRDSQEQMVLSEELVPGDVVILSAGSLIPADGILLEAKDFFVNQSVLTGETFPVEKIPGMVPAESTLQERTNYVFMGTNVRTGSAKLLITQTGRQTSYGQIAKHLTLRPPETEFDRGIHRLGYLLTEIMFILVITIFAVNVLLKKPILDALLFSIALAVGLTPQLLPAIINMNLSKGSQLMAAAGVIVRRLSSIENFGSMDILCTDKTGTLTLGVVKLDGALGIDGKPSEKVLHAAWLNAHFQAGMSDPLDDAIINSGTYPATEDQKIDEIPYDFIRKRLSIVVKGDLILFDEIKAKHLIVTKGAFQNILEVCDFIQLGEKVEILNETHRDGLQQRYAKWSDEGYRVLGVAIRPAGEKDCYDRTDEKQMIFLGFLLFFDPPKPGVMETVSRLQKLGVNLKIITGDNHLVAAHTARAIGIPDPKVMIGSDLGNMHDDALMHVAERTDIFAEVDPNQKEKIILALKKTGHVVGYMGDGVNDAPSLHNADVSISVDNAVDVAKESADFVLMKQDLEVLEQGIINGRKIFANTLKYVFMATSANFGNMFSVAGASLFLPFLPMLPKQILLINFLTDLPEMTIAGDKVDDIFIQRPHRWNVNFIRLFMLVFGTLSSIFDYATFILLLYGLKASQQSFHTGWFIESVLSAALVVFAMRTRLPIQKSHPSRAMMIVTAIVCFVAFVIPYSPIASLLGFSSLPLHYLGLIVAIVIIYFICAEFTKRLFYKQLGIHEKQ